MQLTTEEGNEFVIIKLEREGENIYALKANGQTIIRFYGQEKELFISAANLKVLGFEKVYNEDGTLQELIESS